MMVYPARGWRWVFFRAPLWLWRMGLGPLMDFRMCVLTTWGRTSGQPRSTMLEWVELDGKAYLGAGWGPRAHWVRNVLDRPDVTLQARLGTVRGRALRTTDAEVLRRLYPKLRASPVWDAYCAHWGVDGSDPDDVAAKADRLWTFVVEPGSNAAPPPLRADLWWIPALLALALTFWLLA